MPLIHTFRAEIYVTYHTTDYVSPILLHITPRFLLLLVIFMIPNKIAILALTGWQGLNHCMETPIKTPLKVGAIHFFFLDPPSLVSRQKLVDPTVAAEIPLPILLLLQQ